MKNTNWADGLRLKIHNVYATVFQLSGYDDNQLKEKEDVIIFEVASLLEQEKIKMLEALPKEKDYKVRDDFANWFDNGWNACLKEIKKRLTK
jgi:hypothetical protein